MNRDFLDEFINQLEKIMEVSNKDEYVQDSKKSYLKIFYLENLIIEAKELIGYGEYVIALENMLENLNEVSILLDKYIVNLARQAFGEQITMYMEELLKKLTK
jgi:hypothetical protein